MYQTVEAEINKERIIIPNSFSIPKKTRKVFVTFIDDDSNLEPIIGSEEVLGTKEHNDFISLLKSA